MASNSLFSVPWQGRNARGKANRHKRRRLMGNADSQDLSTSFQTPQPSTLDSSVSWQSKLQRASSSLPTESGANFRRYYPKELQASRPANQFFRSTSLQLELNRSRDASPLSKKPKTNFANESFISLPLSPRAEEEEYDDEEMQDQATTPTQQATTDGEQLIDQPSTSTQINGEHQPADATMQQHPITKAVIERGLRAKFKSFGVWLAKRDKEFKSSASLPTAKHPQALIKTSTSLSSSLRHTASAFSSPSKLRFDSLSLLGRSRKRRRDGSTVTISEQAGSTASLNSLSDGRTPWPIPWIEGVFLPEYPTKGPVNERHFAIIGSIASGAFGKVLRVCLKTQPTAIFAMKVQSKSEVITNDAIQQIKHEVSIHESMNGSGFVAQLYASWQSRSKLYTVLQYATGYGDLYQLWRDQGPFPEDAVRIISAEVITALDFIHSKGVIYRDLKMENIVLDDFGHIQLVDFGLAKWLGVGDTTKTIAGSLPFLAPEIAGEYPYGHSVDWWCLGVLMFVLLTGKYPFSYGNHHSTIAYDNPLPAERLSKDANELLEQLLCQNSGARLQSLCEAQQQPFFFSIDFDSIQEKKASPYDYLPRMKSCLSCNRVSEEEIDKVEDGDLRAFGEGYEPFSEFSYFCDDIPFGM